MKQRELTAHPPNPHQGGSERCAARPGFETAGIEQKLIKQFELEPDLAGKAASRQQATQREGIPTGKDLEGADADH